MAIVDQHGRLFGRFNIVDAVVAIFVLGLIPLMYGAAVLFRTPQPKLTAIEPASIAVGSNQRVTIRGEHLRPYMRVSLGDHQGRSFLFKSINEAQIELNDMPPGTYDVVLYDVAQEQTRLPKAFTVLPSPLPPTRVTMVGMFGNLDAERARQLKPGDSVAGVGTIRAVGEPLPAKLRVSANGMNLEVPVERAVMVPAAVEAGCDVVTQGGVPYCQGAGVILQPLVVLRGEHPVGTLPFQIDQIRGPLPLDTVEVVVRLTAASAIIRSIRKGDVDYGSTANPLAAGATVVDIRSHAINPDLDQADVTLRVRVERGSNGWIYTMQQLRAGTDFGLRTARYHANGPVLSVHPEWAPSK